MIYLEEAAFMSGDVIKQVVLPLLGVKNTSTIAISTPEDEFNHYTKLIELKVNGKFVFKVIRVGLSCSKCLRLGLLCIHRRSKLPAWKDVSRQEMIEAMYGDGDADKRLMLRETHGVIIGADIYVYRLYIHAFRSMKPYSYKDKIQVVHVGLDPAAGGAGSDWGLTATCYENAKYVVSCITSSDRNPACCTLHQRYAGIASVLSLCVCTVIRLVCAR